MAQEGDGPQRDVPRGGHNEPQRTSKRVPHGSQFQKSNIARKLIQTIGIMSLNR